MNITDWLIIVMCFLFVGIFLSMLHERIKKLEKK
jgi:hypothetical protein